MVFEKDSVLKDLQLEAKERPLGLIIGVEGGRINGTLTGTWKQDILVKGENAMEKARSQLIQFC